MPLDDKLPHMRQTDNLELGGCMLVYAGDFGVAETAAAAGGRA